MDTYPASPRTQVRRLPNRGAYDRATVHAILDEAFLCHVAFVDNGSPVVIPTSYARAGEQIYIHGSKASRMLRTLAQGAEVSIAVTLVDGLVLARSAFHHSINYRSVVLFGTAKEVTHAQEKAEALRLISEHLIPGRWEQVRVPNEKELAATAVVAIPIEEVSAKLRTGPPIDDEEDYEIPVWAGVLPLQLIAGDPVGDNHVLESTAVPSYVSQYRRSSRLSRKVNEELA
jgi:uncharacterized protein